MNLRHVHHIGHNAIPSQEAARTRATETTEVGYCTVVWGLDADFNRRIVSTFYIMEVELQGMCHMIYVLTISMYYFYDSI